MEDMVGNWRLEHRDSNFGEFLACRQVGWFLRTLISSSKPDVEYKLNADKTTFTKITKSMMKTEEYKMPTEGEFCPLKTLSGRPEVGQLQETSGQNVILQMDFIDSGENAAVITHKVVDNKLHMSLKCKDIVCNTVYTRMPES